MPLAIAGATTGSATLEAVDGVTVTLTLPATSGTLVTSATAGFASGTVMLFVQTAAPTGWTKSTTHDNKALRIVSGAAGSGGSVAFTTAFASQTPAGTVSVTVGAGTFAVAATTLSESQMPAHTHQQGRASENLTLAYGRGPGTGRSDSLISSTQNLPYVQTIGGSGSHTHSLSGAPSVTSSTFTGTAIDLAVQYVDVIIATKD